MVHAKEKGKSARRIKSVDEIISIDHETLKPNTFRSVEWNPADDTFKFNKDSYLLKKIANNRGIAIEEVHEEIARRKLVLEWMLKNGIKDFIEVRKIINEYYKNPEKLMEQVGAEIPAIEKELEKKEEIEEKPTKEKAPVTIPEVFGFKIVSEK
jgi:flagellar protein FlaI